MSSPPPRVAVVSSAFVLAAVCAFAVVVVRRKGGGYVPPSGRCEVASTRALTSGAADRPIGLGHHDRALWALALKRDGAASRAVLIRSVSGRDAPLTVASSALPSGSTLAGPVASRRGVAFAVAAGPAVRVTRFDGRAASADELPRGEAPPGREARTPRLSVAAESDGSLAVAAHWGDAFGTRRLHQRDTRESPELGPRRRDRFDSPALAVRGDAVVVVQERHVGTFLNEAAVGAEIDAVVLPAAPFDAAAPREAVLSHAPQARAPRVAATDDAAVALWREDDRLVATRLDPGAPQLGVAGTPLTLGPAGGSHDLAAGAHCALAVMDRAGVIEVRGLDARTPTLRAGGAASTPAPATVEALRVARVGDGFLVVALGDGRLQAWRAAVDGACAPTIAPFALGPTRPPRPGLRLLALSGDASGATLLTTVDPSDAARTVVARVEVDPAFVVGREQSEMVPQSVLVGARQDARVALVAGPDRDTVRLQRLGDAVDDDEPGEDVLLRLARGTQLAMVASAERHRIWVADRGDDDHNPFHPPRAVVVHSVIDTLEDGPRTETATAAAPPAAFGSVALHRFDADGAGPTWALVTAPDPTVSPGLDGPWVFLFDDRDQPAPRPAAEAGPWPHAAPLLPAELRSSHDRVLAVAWRGPEMAAIVSGPRAGVRLVTGDPYRAALRSGPIAATPPTMLRAATVVPSATGWVAVWLDVTHASPELYDRRFDAHGAPAAAPDRLGEFLHLDESALDLGLAATSMGPDEFAVAVPTPHGVRVAEVRCSR